MRNIIIDSQFLDGVQFCEQKYTYTFVNHLQTVRKSKKMEMGSLLHDFLEVYYKNLNEKGHDESLKLSLAEYDNFVQNFELTGMDCEIVKNTFEENVDFWKQQPLTVKSVEVPLTKLLYEDDELRIAYVSKMDLVVDGVNFDNMPIDHKSEHMKSNPNPMNNQFIGYAWASESNRILINKIGFQKTLKPIDKYRRIPLYYTDSQIEEWKEQTVFWVKKMLELIDGRRPEMNRTSCDKWGGCTYLDVCKLSPDNRQDFLNNSFKVGEEWSPFRNDKDD